MVVAVKPHWASGPEVSIDKYWASEAVRIARLPVKTKS